MRVEEEEPTLLDVLGGQFRDRNTYSERMNSNRMRDRFSSNIVREPVI